MTYLRTLDDALALNARLTEHLLIVGAGWIGLEVAAAAREAGGTVTVVDPAALPLAHLLGDGFRLALRRPAPRARCRPTAQDLGCRDQPHPRPDHRPAHRR